MDARQTAEKRGDDDGG